MERAIFLDKDGTLIKDIPYNVDTKKIVVFENAFKGLKELQDMGFKIIVVTNQSGVGLGYCKEEEVKNVGEYLFTYLNRFSIRLDGYYYCPHHPGSAHPEYRRDCSCRKPKEGMILKAATIHEINLSNSWMIGDILNDVEAGSRAGCKTVLINNGNETEWLLGPYRRPDFVAENLKDALESIVDLNRKLKL